MKAKRKPLETVSTDDLDVSVKRTVKLLKVESPAERSAGVKVADVDELVDKLKNEAKVL